MGPTFFGPKFFLGPTIFFGPKLFWTQIILDPNYFGHKIILDTIFFWAHKIFSRLIFWGPKFFWDLTFFQTNFFVRTQIFFKDTQLFSTQIFLRTQNFFLIKFFCLLRDFHLISGINLSKLNTLDSKRDVMRNFWRNIICRFDWLPWIPWANQRPSLFKAEIIFLQKFRMTSLFL